MMKNSYFKSVIVPACFASILFSPIVQADFAYVCSQAGFERRIDVVYQNAPSLVPCEVLYDKGEGPKILWYAENLTGYCEEKAENFVAQQESWGWSCIEESTEEFESISDEAALNTLPSDEQVESSLTGQEGISQLEVDAASQAVTADNSQ